MSINIIVVKVDDDTRIPLGKYLIALSEAQFQQHVCFIGRKRICLIKNYSTYM